MAVTFEDALAAVLSLARTTVERTVPLSEAAGEVLARDVAADRDIPPFPRAAMDGFALSWTGRENERPFRIAGVVDPGQVWTGRPAEDECVKIMTGAAVPAPFDTIVAVEQAEVQDDGRVRFTAPVSRGQNVAPMGEDARQGETVVSAGTLLRPRHVAALAAVGCWEVPVRAKPSIAVLATGKELKEPWEPAAGPFIRNSNAHFLLSALKAHGFPEAVYLGIAQDEEEPLRQKIAQGLAFDCLIITGGVSAGDTDLVPACLAACGVEKVLHKVEMKPGKPLFVGKSPGGGIVVGLPGNPVAVIVHYSMLVRPLLLKSLGAREYLPKSVALPLARETFNKGERKKFVPARIDSISGESRVVEIPFHGSGDFVGASRADGVFEIPLGVRRLPAGAIVRFYPVWGEMLLEEG